MPGDAGIELFASSKVDSYDNALAETINGLGKAEVIYRRAPWTTKEFLPNWDGMHYGSAHSGTGHGSRHQTSNFCGHFWP